MVVFDSRIFFNFFFYYERSKNALVHFRYI